jgi:hypothetical protein
MRNKILNTRVTSTTLCGLSLVLFFTQEAFRVLIATVLPFLSYNMTVYLIILLMYFPLILSLVLRRKSNGYLIRFLICLGLVAAIFFVTYLIHPEYSYWFFESSYPIGTRIFRPNQYLYAFLFVSAVDDPDELIKYMKVVAYILLAYYSYRLLRASMLGYWITTTTAQGPTRTSYDLNYGYDHLIVLTTFICCAFREKKIYYFILAGISLVEILLGGSRGPLISVAILLLIMYLRYKQQFSKLARIAVFLGVALLVALYFLPGGMQVIMMVLRAVLGRIFGSSSARTIQMLIEGQVHVLLDNSGRTRLYNMAIDMIKNGFWGYGAYGDRYVIGRIYWVGYCHNIFLELLIDYGWIIGGILCISIVVNSLKMLITCKNESWWICFVIFFVPSMKLLLSGSYWYLEAFWACIAVCLMYRKHIRLERVYQWDQRIMPNKSRVL